MLYAILWKRGHQHAIDELDASDVEAVAVEVLAADDIPSDIHDIADRDVGAEVSSVQHMPERRDIAGLAVMIRPFRTGRLHPKASEKARRSDISTTDVR